MVSLLWCPWAPQLPQDVSADAGFLCDKPAMSGDTIKRTFCIPLTQTTWKFRPLKLTVHAILLFLPLLLPPVFLQLLAAISTDARHCRQRAALFKALAAKYSKTCLKRTPYIPETWTNGK